MGGNSLPKKRGMLRALNQAAKGMLRDQEEVKKQPAKPRRISYRVDGVRYTVGKKP